MCGRAAMTQTRHGQAKRPTTAVRGIGRGSCPFRRGREAHALGGSGGGGYAGEGLVGLSTHFIDGWYEIYVRKDSRGVEEGAQGREDTRQNTQKGEKRRECERVERGLFEFHPVC